MKTTYTGRRAFMRLYKNHPLHVTSAASQGGGWHPRGLVFDPKVKPATEIKRLEATELFCFTKEEADEIALMLCRSWIDGLAAASKKQG
jgi:hypothetical protein